MFNLQHSLYLSGDTLTHMIHTKLHPSHHSQSSVVKFTLSIKKKYQNDPMLHNIHEVLAKAKTKKKVGYN